MKPELININYPMQSITKALKYIPKRTTDEEGHYNVSKRYLNAFSIKVGRIKS